MKVLNIYLKVVRADKMQAGFNNALHYCRARLQDYFTRCVNGSKTRFFSSANVSFTASQTISDLDLLVYFVPGVEFTLVKEKPSEGAAGRTISSPNGILSEVFANRAMEEGNKPEAQGIALANLAFHELAHNKSHALPSTETEKYRPWIRKTPGPLTDITHLAQGIMGNMPKGDVAGFYLTETNVQWMAAMVKYPIKQYIG